MPLGAPKSLSTCKRFFLHATSPKQRQYEALRAYYVDERPATAVARDFGYSPGAFHVMCHHFRRQAAPVFFASPRPGPLGQPNKSAARESIIALRTRHHPIYEVSAALSALLLPVRRPPG